MASFTLSYVQKPEPLPGQFWPPGLMFDTPAQGGVVILCDL